MADIWVTFAAATRPAAAGVTSGPNASPAITKTASIRQMMRRKLIGNHCTAAVACEETTIHIFASRSER
jgi:hypothetical protein